MIFLRWTFILLLWGTDPILIGSFYILIKELCINFVCWRSHEVRLLVFKGTSSRNSKVSNWKLDILISTRFYPRSKELKKKKMMKLIFLQCKYKINRQYLFFAIHIFLKIYWPANMLISVKSRESKVHILFSMIIENIQCWSNGKK